MITVIATII